jgi:peptidoglycan/xylan/chitin deacetylase (PgdA/CDA1 family)
MNSYEAMCWKDVAERVSAGLILMYHRVADVALDPFSLAVSPEHFKEHLEILQKYWLPTRLDDMVAIVRSGRTPERRVAVTFDDGYADVFKTARVLLETYGIPATVFLITGHIGSTREFMWDELERLLLQPGLLPERLHLSIADQMLEWDLGEWANYSEMAYLRDLGWKFEHKHDPTSRHALFRKLYYHLKYASESERRRVLGQILVWSRNSCEGRETHRTMRLDEIQSLSREGLVTIGSHTVNHPVLAEIPLQLQQKEAQESKFYIEEVLGYPITSFAYPYGGPTDYTPETVTILKDAGYGCSCSTLDGIVFAGSDLYQLPRVDIKDWDGDEFARHLRMAQGK